MKNKKDSVILFSGRFDRPHIGHAITLQRLGLEYKHVHVLVLKYDDEEYPACYRAQILTELLNNSKGTFTVYVNQVHFGSISKEQITSWEFDVYGSGNHEVLKHVQSLGVETVYVERSYDYDATTDRTMKKIREIILDETN